jgi:hypothetical protein
VVAAGAVVLVAAAGAVVSVAAGAGAVVSVATAAGAVVAVAGTAVAVGLPVSHAVRIMLASSSKARIDRSAREDIIPVISFPPLVITHRHSIYIRTTHISGVYGGPLSTLTTEEHLLPGCTNKVHQS